MDVELQILKHLPKPTLAIIGTCAEYKIYSKSKGIMSASIFTFRNNCTDKKNHYKIAKVVSINSAQSLHHFIAVQWSVDELKERLNKVER